MTLTDLLLFAPLILILALNLVPVAFFAIQYFAAQPGDHSTRRGLGWLAGLCGINMLVYLTLYALSAHGHIQFVF